MSIQFGAEAATLVRFNPGLKACDGGNLLGVLVRVVRCVDVAGGVRCVFQSACGPVDCVGRAVSGDGELARDLAQEAFLRLHRHWDRLDDQGEIGPWLTRVMANLLIDHHRSAEAERRAVDRLHARTVVSSANAAAEIDEWSNLVAGLPPRQRLIVTLHYGEDLSIEQISRIIEVSPNTVKSALAKARVALRANRERESDER